MYLDRQNVIEEKEISFRSSYLCILKCECCTNVVRDETRK